MRMQEVIELNTQLRYQNTQLKKQVRELEQRQQHTREVGQALRLMFDHRRVVSGREMMAMMEKLQ